MISKSDLVAKAVILNEKNQILILVRSKDEQIHTSTFDLPGGGVELGEGPDDAVVREILEETKLDVSKHPSSLQYSSTVNFRGRSIIRFVYVFRDVDISPLKLSNEHDAYYWMDIPEAIKKYDHPVYSEAINYIAKHVL